MWMRALREDIDKLQSGRDVEDADITDGNTLMDEVEVDLHVLHVMVLHGIGDEVDRADVVTVDECGAHEGVMELLEHVTARMP
jgi:nucleoside-triphosphatase THEP1